MATEGDYEMAEQDIDAYHELRELAKRGKEIDAAANLIKARFKKLAGGAEYLTMGGERVLHIVTAYPKRFDTKRFKEYDPRLYEQFTVVSDTPVTSLLWVGEKP
jgi:hypothetical protein